MRLFQVRWPITTPGAVLPARAVDQADLDKRIRTLTTKFEEMQAKPDKRIPAENLRKAQGIILLDRTKAGFIFAYQGGGGLAMVKDAKSGQLEPAGVPDAPTKPASDFKLAANSPLS